MPCARNAATAASSSPAILAASVGLFVVGLRVVMTWVYNNTGRSLFAMGLLHPGLFVWWYLWPVDGTGLSVPSFYDPRSLAITAAVLALVVTYGWGARTLARNRFAKRDRRVRADFAKA